MSALETQVLEFIAKIDAIDETSFGKLGSLFDCIARDAYDIFVRVQQRDERMQDLLSLAYQYQSDLRHPPTADSVERRLERIAAVLAKVGGA